MCRELDDDRREWKKSYLDLQLKNVKLKAINHFPSPGPFHDLFKFTKTYMSEIPRLKSIAESPAFIFNRHGVDPRRQKLWLMWRRKKYIRISSASSGVGGGGYVLHLKPSGAH